MNIKDYIETLIIDGLTKDAIIEKLKLKGFSDIEIATETALLPTIPSLAYENNFVQNGKSTLKTLMPTMGFTLLSGGLIWNFITGFHSNGLPYFCIFIGLFMVVASSINKR